MIKNGAIVAECSIKMTEWLEEKKSLNWSGNKMAKEKYTLRIEEELLKNAKIRAIQERIALLINWKIVERILK